ncbi:MAG: phage major capsid protein [Eubacterium sp.]|nr:phage major capsid protein [Eubacterium sp.]
MAIRALMIGKKLRDKKKALEEARAKVSELEKREAELEQAIDEAETDEERAAVEAEVAQYEADKEAADKEATDLEAEVGELEKELENTPNEVPDEAPVKEERAKESFIMEKRFRDMNYQEREAFVGREDVKAFLEEVRTAMKEKRAVSNVGYLIPDSVLGMLRQSIDDYSKLYNAVKKINLKGTGRMIIEGQIPEAVWTEACANLNELDLSFSKVEVDGYKVGGYFKVCNATLEDTDINLASELIDKLGQAIGLALDAAIIFGTGTKMPVGIVTALKAVTSTPNIVTHASTVTGKALVEALIDDAALISSKYSSADYIWVMNKKTHLTIKKNMLNVDANGLYVAGNDFPIIGGQIIELSFMPDNVIVGGYGDLYLLAERAGTEISTSEHAFWVADQTGFKGTARYDGKVLDVDAFVAIGINGADGDDMVHTFPQDGANL